MICLFTWILLNVQQWRSVYLCWYLLFELKKQLWMWSFIKWNYTASIASKKTPIIKYQSSARKKKSHRCNFFFFFNNPTSRQSHFLFLLYSQQTATCFHFCRPAIFHSKKNTHRNASKKSSAIRWLLVQKCCCQMKTGTSSCPKTRLSWQVLVLWAPDRDTVRAMPTLHEHCG